MAACSKEVTIECSKCGRGYEELESVVQWALLHPVRPLVCIACDQFALVPACSGLTGKGMLAAFVVPVTPEIKRG